MKRLFLLIVLWLAWSVGAAVTSPIFIPPPGEVVQTFVRMIWNGDMLRAFSYSLIRITIAACLSAVAALVIGCSMRLLPVVQELFYPLVQAMRFIPITAFYPLLTLWFGIDEGMKIAFLFVASFSFMLPSVLAALNDVNPEVVEAANIDGAGKVALMKNIILPIAAPTIAQSFVTMYAIGWTYISVAETVNAKYGVGYLIYTSSARGKTVMVFVGIMAIVLFSVIFDWLAKQGIKKIFKWKFS